MDASILKPLEVPKLSRAAGALQPVMGEGHMGDVDEIFDQAVIALGSVESASSQHTSTAGHVYALES